MQPQITWVAKMSKFCNMRCLYCYEWDELSKRDRIGIDLWERLFRAMKEYREFADTTTQGGGRTRSMLVLHGGEPMALPLSYLSEVMALHREILGDDRGIFPVAMQTNGYRITDAMIEFLLDQRIHIGVSLDIVPGVRRSVAGNATETQVRTNLLRMREAGCLMSGGIVVLARHTAPRVREIYDWYASHDLSFRILPLFAGPDSRPGGFEISSDEMANALIELFDHWITQGATIRVEPFPSYLRCVAQHLIGVRDRLLDRGIERSLVFIVNTDGTVYQIPEAYESEKMIGDLRYQTIMEIMRSQAYWNLVERDRARVLEHCRGCEYASSCRALPLIEASRSVGPYTGRCPVVYNFYTWLTSYVIENGYTSAELGALLSEPDNPAENSLLAV